MWTSFDFFQHFKGCYKGESYDPGFPAPPGIFSPFPISSQPTRLSAISLLSERLLIFLFFIFVSPFCFCFFVCLFVCLFFFWFWVFWVFLFWDSCLVLGVLGGFIIIYLRNCC